MAGDNCSGTSQVVLRGERFQMKANECFFDLSRVCLPFHPGAQPQNYPASHPSSGFSGLPSRKPLLPQKTEGPSKPLTSLERALSTPTGKSKTSTPLVRLASDTPRTEIILGGNCQKSQLSGLESTGCQLNFYSELQPELSETKHSHWQAPQLASFPRAVLHEL